MERKPYNSVTWSPGQSKHSLYFAVVIVVIGVLAAAVGITDVCFGGNFTTLRVLGEYKNIPHVDSGADRSRRFT